MTTSRAGSAITAMWARDNPVSSSDDDQGRGFAPAAPDRLAAYAEAGELREVYLAAPWPVHEGPWARWFGEACEALHGVGVELSVLGGDAAWLQQPALVAQWLADARAAGEFDRVHLEVEPWQVPGWSGDKSGAMRGYLTVLDVARSAAGPLPVDVTAPWWLAHEPFTDDGDAAHPAQSAVEPAGTTMLDALLAGADRVSILAHANHADGPRGILTLADHAVGAAVAAGRPFTIGVETATPTGTADAKLTFFDEGPVALLREAAVVHHALTDRPGYLGVAVADHRGWRRLLGV
ncbi:hypothetical protein [Pengzhenrongella sp.]|jgi:hypothetical protein|uniref:hypothetical protein n=1 Tax=Pengzhenrongella sp. TaxID=2888820 RepID=UPI002F958F70